MTAATPGQAAYEALRTRLFPQYLDGDEAVGWDELEPDERDGFEQLAQVVIASQDAQPAPGSCPKSFTPAATGGEPDPHTDTCDLPEGHAGNHRCPGCDVSWSLLSEHLAGKRRQPQDAPGLAEERDRLALRLHVVRAILLDENASAGDARSRAAAAAYDEVLPQPAPELAALRSPVTGLIGMWDGMRKVHAPSDGEWDDWRAVLGRLVEELASQLGAIEEAAQEPRPAPGSAGVLSVSRGDGTPGGGLMAYVRTEPKPDCDGSAEPEPAPGLAAAMAEARAMRDIVCNLLDLFGAPDQRFMQHASVTRATLRRYAGEAGVRLDGREGK